MYTHTLINNTFPFNNLFFNNIFINHTIVLKIIQVFKETPLYIHVVLWSCFRGLVNDMFLSVEKLIKILIRYRANNQGKIWIVIKASNLACKFYAFITF